MYRFGQLPAHVFYDQHLFLKQQLYIKSKPMSWTHGIILDCYDAHNSGFSQSLALDGLFENKSIVVVTKIINHYKNMKITTVFT